MCPGRQGASETSLVSENYTTRQADLRILEGHVRLVKPTSIPVLGRPKVGVVRPALDPMDMFLLALVDGALTLTDLYDIMPCGRDETERRTEKLVKYGVLELTEERASAIEMRTPRSGEHPIPSAYALEEKLSRAERLLAELEALGLPGVSPDTSLRALRAMCVSAVPPAKVPSSEVMKPLRTAEPATSAAALPLTFDDTPSTVRMRPHLDPPAPPPPADQPAVERVEARPMAALRGEALRMEGDCRWREAAEAWREVLDREPNSRMAILRLAHCLLESGDAQLANRYARQAVRSSPKDLEARLMLGRVYEALGLSLSARKERDVACELNRKRKGS